MNTTENNKLIAEFMELPKYGISEYKHPLMICDLDNMRYNSSWDWLMPVVDKIEELEFKGNFGTDYYDVHIMPDAIMIYKQSNEDSPLFINNKSDGVGSVNCNIPTFEDKKTALYNVVVEFIKWYNKQIK